MRSRRLAAVPIDPGSLPVDPDDTAHWRAEYAHVRELAAAGVMDTDGWRAYVAAGIPLTDAPRAIGFVRAGVQDAGLLVRLPGEQRDRRMLAGERAGRWTLLAIEDGNTAVFADPDGRRYRQLIGR